MPQDSPSRSWREVAQELSAETNSEKLCALTKELNHALDQQDIAKNWHPHPPQLETPPKSGTYKTIMDSAVSLMNSDYGSIQMLFPKRGSGGELFLLEFRGFDPEAARFWEWVRADSKSTCGVALRDRKRVVAADIANCAFMAGSEDQQVYLHTGIRACQTTPLIGIAGNVVGMISTHWRTPYEPSREDLLRFDLLAAQAAALIEERGQPEQSAA